MTEFSHSQYPGWGQANANRQADLQRGTESDQVIEDALHQFSKSEVPTVQGNGQSKASSFDSVEDPAGFETEAWLQDLDLN